MTVRELQVLINESAMNTAFARREKPINLLDMATIPLTLVVELAHELRPAGIGNGLGKAVVLHHPFDVQILNSNQAVRFYQLPTEFVGKVKALVGYLFVQFGNLQPGLIPALAALLGLAQLALIPFKAAFGLAQMFGIRESLPVTGNGKVLKSQIKPNLPALIGRVVNLLLYLNRGEILAALGSRHGKVFHNAFNRAMQDNLDPANFRNVQLATFNLETLRKPAGLLTVLLFEVWEFSLLIKEVAIGGIEVAKCLLRSLRIHIFEPVVISLLFEFGKLQGSIVVGQSLAGFGVGINALTKEVVVDKATTAKLLRQFALLLDIWVNPVLVSTFDIHGYNYSIDCVRKQICSKERTSPYIPNLKDWVLRANSITSLRPGKR